MGNYTHQTAPTQFVEAAGTRFAYRPFANRRFGVKIDRPNERAHSASGASEKTKCCHG
jgi:hypothetical protein